MGGMSIQKAGPLSRVLRGTCWFEAPNQVTLESIKVESDPFAGFWWLSVHTKQTTSKSKS